MNDNKNVNATTGNTAPTPAPQQDGNKNDKLMEMKAAYTQFEAEKVQNRTFGEKLLDSLPYVVSGLALGTAGVAVGIAAKSLNTTTKFIESQTTSYSPSPDGDLE